MAGTSRRTLRTLAVTLLLLSGCGDDYERVEYDQPPPPAKVVVEMGHVDLETTNLPKSFTTPELKPNTVVRFKGSVNRLRKPYDDRRVSIRILQEQPGRKPIERSVGNCRGFTEQGDRMLYEVQLETPSTPGLYTVQVIWPVVNTEARTKTWHKIARSTVRIQ